MKKRLIGSGFISLIVLVVVYLMEMKYGWREVVTIAYATTELLGVLFICLLVIFGISLLLRGNFND